MKLDIRNNILHQFSEYFEIKSDDSAMIFNDKIGKGGISLTKFPDGLEFYDFEFKLHAPFNLESSNPSDSEWLLLNINLSDTSVDKLVNNKPINIQKYLPSGILFYPPNTKVSSVSLPHTAYKIVLIRFKKSFLNDYLGDEIKLVDIGENGIIYEDLDTHMETLLNHASDKNHNKLKQHACTLEFIGLFLDKIKIRSNNTNLEKLHPDDIKGLFMASAHLRNPVILNIPTVSELAAYANMGTTKFKTTFKQVFGLPPGQYHQKIKMEYAKRQLLIRSKNISEISHEIGYSHPSKFTAAFKKYFGSLPSQQ